MRKVTPPIALTIILSSLLAGCTVGREYAGAPAVAPAAVARTHFLTTADSIAPTAPVSRWWEGLGDPELTHLIDRALTNAPDIAIALARIDAARSLQERHDGLRVGAAAGAVGLAASEPIAPRLVPGKTRYAAYDVGLQAGWEPDLWGRMRRQREGNMARLETAEAGLADAKVLLSAAVAEHYLRARAHEAAIAIGQQQLPNRDHLVALAALRNSAGTVAAPYLIQAKRDRAVAAAVLAERQVERDAELNALGALVGAEPGELLFNPAPVPLPPAIVTVGDPARLLRNRPDIRMAERRMAAASADRGVAMADRLPKISFFGVLGVGGIDVDRGISLPSLLALAAPRLSLPLFDGGRGRAAVGQATALEAEAAANYRKTVLGALSDCETAMARFAMRRTALAEAMAAENDASMIARLNAQRFKAGTLDGAASERSAMDAGTAASDVATARAAVSLAYIDVMKALGLGWES